jgi:hypothetical protein
MLTQVLLHELVHAWLHQLYPDLYDRHSGRQCDLAERFADAGFIALGGKIKPSRVCGSYRLSSRTAKSNLPRFRSLARSLTQTHPTAIMQWCPPARN